ncbi:MAG TPA: hypothetical protein VMT34_11810 [Aggregatilineales bacterium]|nr:hypothetical protein [Aggregatilineales bacterium]
MSTISNAIAALAAFGATVSGVQHSYDLAGVPEKLSREKLPALIVLPEVGIEQGYKVLGFLGGSPEVTFDVTHLLLYASADAIDARKVLPGLLGLLDNYLAALKANPFLGSTSNPPVHQPTQVQISVGIVDYAGVKYHCLNLKHHLVIYL